MPYQIFLWPWAGYLNSLRHGFLIYNMWVQDLFQLFHGVIVRSKMHARDRCTTNIILFYYPFYIHTKCQKHSRHVASFNPDI